jgi:hypothetical protein
MRLGDPTAKLLGRLTLNPLAHLDPLGSILLLLAGFGWAKPIPVDARYLEHPRRDMMWIALAGPVSNVVLAIAFGTLLRFIPLDALQESGPAGRAVLYMIAKSVQMNLVLPPNMIRSFRRTAARPRLAAQRSPLFEATVHVSPGARVAGLRRLQHHRMFVSPFVCRARS